MELIKEGKTKDIYRLADGNYLLQFKNTVTGHASGESDPGGNQVIGSVEGVASGSLNMTVYFFELLKKHNIPTHYVSADAAKNQMTVRPARLFGQGLEFVVRYKAAGSFIRRFGAYCNEGDALPGLFEVTIKDDARDDPPASKEILDALGIVTPAQFDEARASALTICNLIRDDLARRSLDLIDIKIEFGLTDGKVVLIDEISAGCMRVYENGAKLNYLELANRIGC